MSEQIIFEGKHGKAFQVDGVAYVKTNHFHEGRHHFDMVSMELAAALSAEIAAREAAEAAASECREQLSTVNQHVKEALELLGVDVSVDGYVPDSWTLREQCHLAKGRMEAAEAKLAERQGMLDAFDGQASDLFMECYRLKQAEKAADATITQLREALEDAQLLAANKGSLATESSKDHSRTIAELAEVRRERNAIASRLQEIHALYPYVSNTATLPRLIRSDQRNLAAAQQRIERLETAGGLLIANIKENAGGFEPFAYVWQRVWDEFKSNWQAALTESESP